MQHELLKQHYVLLILRYFSKRSTGKSEISANDIFKKTNILLML